MSALVYGSDIINLTINGDQWRSNIFVPRLMKHTHVYEQHYARVFGNSASHERAESLINMNITRPLRMFAVEHFALRSFAVRTIAGFNFNFYLSYGIFIFMDNRPKTFRLE